MSLDQPPASASQEPASETASQAPLTPHAPASKTHPPRPSLTEMAPLASTGLRFAARLVDAIVLGLLWVVALLVTGQLQYAMEHDGTYQEVPLIVAAAVTFACYFVYEGAMLAHSGQTLGKKAVGIRVAVLSDGNIPGRRGWTRAAVYALPGIVSPAIVGWLFWLVNSLWCLWDQPYRQALHDKRAKTVVVRA
jgi:uncharacterized RDD family membrane protein YckC